MAFLTSHICLTCFSGADCDNIKDFIEYFKLTFEPQASLHNTAKQKAVKLKMLTSNLSGDVEDYYCTLDRDYHQSWDTVTEHLKEM